MPTASPTTTVDVHVAKTTLSESIARAEAGEEVVIARAIERSCD